MRCPHCEADSVRTIDTRPLADSTHWIVKRKRHCDHCRRDFDTLEILAPHMARLEKHRLVLEGLKELLEGMKDPLKDET